MSKDLFSRRAALRVLAGGGAFAAAGGLAGCTSTTGGFEAATGRSWPANVDEFLYARGAAQVPATNGNQEWPATKDMMNAPILTSVMILNCQYDISIFHFDHTHENGQTGTYKGLMVSENEDNGCCETELRGSREEHVLGLAIDAAERFTGERIPRGQVWDLKQLAHCAPDRGSDRDDRPTPSDSVGGGVLGDGPAPGGTTTLG